MNPPDIYEYIDFRKYLGAYYEALQASDPGFSKSKVAKVLGIPNTRGYFNEILKGRELSETFAHRMVESLLDLSLEEEQYFKAMVRYNQCAGELDRSLLLDKLVELNKTPRKILDKKLYAFYRSWYHATIRAHLDILDLTTNFTEFGKKIHPPLSGKQVRESVRLMAKLGLIQKNAEGIWKPSDPAIASGNSLKNEMIKKYTAECFELGKAAIYQEIGQKRNLSTMTLSMSEKTLQKILKKVQTFKSEIRSIVNKEKDPADRVYQLNLQLFPQTSIEKKL